jgi:hypothetical protein
MYKVTVDQLYELWLNGFRWYDPAGAEDCFMDPSERFVNAAEKLNIVPKSILEAWLKEKKEQLNVQGFKH